ncbi:hypothetical protein ACLKA7_012723 [Drosophila subpalustris]
MCDSSSNLNSGATMGLRTASLICSKWTTCSNHLPAIEDQDRDRDRDRAYAVKDLGSCQSELIVQTIKSNAQSQVGHRPNDGVKLNPISEFIG